MAINGAAVNSKFSFEWRIHYKTLQPKFRYEVGEFTPSPNFSSGLRDKSEWQMVLYPSGVDVRNENTVSLYVCWISSKDNDRLQAKIKFSIFNAKSGRLLIMRELNTATCAPGKSAHLFGFDNFVRWDDLRQEDDANIDIKTSHLTLVCAISEIGTFDESVQQIDISFTVPKCPSTDNLRNLFTSNDLSDVTLTVCERSFKAHKLILAIHSPVFLAMFKPNMTEVKMKEIHNEVKITKVTPRALEEMLRFMYTGEVMDIETIALSLLKAADKYKVVRLKAICEEELYKSITVMNAANILVDADKYSANQLKPRVLTFMASFTTDVTATAGFQQMIQFHPHLVVEMLHELAKTQK